MNRPQTVMQTSNSRRYRRRYAGGERVAYVTDRDGALVQHLEYAPFGEVFLDERGSGEWSSPYLFNAKELDPETGLYYYGARYYDPRLAMWISPDPLQEKYPDCTSYAYCSNDPINKFDPNGEWEENAEGNLVADKNDNINSLALYLNTSKEIAEKMLDEQGNLNISQGFIFNIERTTARPHRVDLGIIGNLIRNQAGSDFSKDLFENYWNGNGDLELTGKRFAGILLDIKSGAIPIKEANNIILKNEDGTVSRGTVNIADFYGNAEYRLAFGRASIYKNSSGNIVGFYDYYDFDSKPFGVRTFKNEIITRTVDYASPRYSQPFAIRYGYSKRK